MKKQIVILLSAMIISIFLINIASAELEFWQTLNDNGNATVNNHLTLFYSKTNSFGFADDYILGNKPLEVYIQYQMYVKSFNQGNPNYKIDYCEFKIRTSKRLFNSSAIVFIQNFTENSADVVDGKYFIQLSDGDGLYADQTCYYENKSLSLSIINLVIPAEMIIVMPTFECKACQFYLWTKQEADIEKTVLIGDNVGSVSEYIQKLISLNFEFILAVFWISLILMIFIAIGFIFIGVYWLFIYISRVIK